MTDKQWLAVLIVLSVLNVMMSPIAMWTGWYVWQDWYLIPNCIVAFLLGLPLDGTLHKVMYPDREPPNKTQE